MMVFEFVGGPKDGDIIALEEGRREWNIPRRVSFPTMWSDADVMPYLQKLEYGVYRVKDDVLVWEGWQ